MVRQQIEAKSHLKSIFIGIIFIILVICIIYRMIEQDRIEKERIEKERIKREKEEKEGVTLLGIAIIMLPILLSDYRFKENIVYNSYYNNFCWKWRFSELHSCGDIIGLCFEINNEKYEYIKYIEFLGVNFKN